MSILPQHIELQSEQYKSPRIDNAGALYTATNIKAYMYFVLPGTAIG